MDRLSRPDLPQLDRLTPDDLPKLIEQRKMIAASIEQTASVTELSRLHSRWTWLNEQIGYLTAKQRAVKP